MGTDSSNQEDAAGIGPGSAGPSGQDLQLLTKSEALKIILLGDSAVGKSKLVERFLLDDYRPHQLSTYAVTLFRHTHTTQEGQQVPVDIWDTAGQERFQHLHASYYYKAHACLMVFDVTRKVTYKNLEAWYEELQQYAKGVPVIVVANKIDVNYEVTNKKFAFADKHRLPFVFVSASDGSNVVKVFNMAIAAGLKWRAAPKEDFYQEVLQLLGQADMKPAQQLVAEDKASKAAGAAGAGTALADAARAKEQQKQGSGSRPSYSIGAVH